MSTHLTPKRRKLNKAARLQADAMASAWRSRTGAWSSNEMMGLGMRSGLLHQYIVSYVEEHDAFPTGIHHIRNTSHYSIGDLRIEFAEDCLPKGGWYEGWAEAHAALVKRIMDARARRERESERT